MLICPWSVLNKTLLILLCIELLVTRALIKLLVLQLSITTVHGNILYLLLMVIRANAFFHLRASCEAMRIVRIGWAPLDLKVARQLVVLNPHRCRNVHTIALPLVFSASSATGCRVKITFTVNFLYLSHLDLLFLLSPARCRDLLNQLHLVLLGYCPLTLLPLTKHSY